MRVWIAGLVVGLLVGCNNHHPDPSIAVAEETLVQARYANYDYLATLANAEGGNLRSIASLMAFSAKVDAAGGLGHGVVMIELLSIIGDSTFAAVLADQPEEMLANDPATE